MKHKDMAGSLHNHTVFSLIDAVCTPEEMLKAYADRGCKFVGLSDHGHISNFFQAEEVAPKLGVTWVAGCEYYCLIPELNTYGHLTTLAVNDIGKKNLMRLFHKSFDNLSKARWGKKKSQITWDLLEQYNEGLFAGTGCLVGLLGRCVMKGDLALAEKNLDHLIAIFGKDRLFAEIIPHSVTHDYNTKTNQFEPNECRDWALDGDLQKGYTQWLWDKAVLQRGLKPVITLDAHFTEPSKKPIQDAMLMKGESGWHFKNSYHILTPDEIYNNLTFLPNFNENLYESMIDNALHFCYDAKYTPTDKSIKLAFQYPDAKTGLSALGNAIKPERVKEILDRHANKIIRNL